MLMVSNALDGTDTVIVWLLDDELGIDRAWQIFCTNALAQES